MKRSNAGQTADGATVPEGSALARRVPGAPAPAEASLFQVLRSFPRPVWVLFAGTFINRFGTFVVPFLTLHLIRLGYSAGQAGSAIAAYGAGHWAASAIGGHLADTFGRRKTIVLSMMLGAMCMLALSQAQSLVAILTVAFLTGLVGEFYRPASSALLTDLVPDAHRVTAFAAYRFAINAGWAFGPSVGGLLAHYSYFWLFVGDAATSVIYGVLAAVLLPRDPPGAHRLDVVRQAFRSLSEAWVTASRDRRFVRLLIATLGVGAVFMQMSTTLGVQMRASGYSEWLYGLVLGLNGVLIVAFEIPMSTFTRRPRPTTMIATGFVLVGCGAGLFAWADTPLGFFAAMAVLTAGEIVSMPVAMAYVTHLAPAAMRGRYLGVYGLTWATALTCGPSAGAWVYARNPTALWIGCGLTCVVAAWIMRPWPR